MKPSQGSVNNFGSVLRPTLKKGIQFLLPRVASTGSNFFALVLKRSQSIIVQRCQALLTTDMKPPIGTAGVVGHCPRTDLLGARHSKSNEAVRGLFQQGPRPSPLQLELRRGVICPDRMPRVFTLVPRVRRRSGRSTFTKGGREALSCADRVATSVTARSFDECLSLVSRGAGRKLRTKRPHSSTFCSSHPLFLMPLLPQTMDNGNLMHRANFGGLHDL